MVAVKHKKVAPADDGSKAVNATEWNDDHDKGDLADSLNTFTIAELNTQVSDATLVDMPNTIANVLTDHTKAAHDTLALSHDSLSDVSQDDHHRKWSWADEQGWINLIRVPLGNARKSGSNPIHNVTAPNTEFFQPCVVRSPFTADDAVEYKYWLFYCESIANKKINVAYSNDGLSWTEGANNPIISGNGTGNWHDVYIAGTSVMYDEVDSIWKMWLIGKKSGES